MKKFAIHFSIIACLVILGACARYAVTSRVVIPSSPLQSPEDPEAAFREIKSRWTVVLGSTGGRPMMMPGGGEPRGGGPFPLTITATLMDSSVVRAGMRYYRDLAEMSAEEDESFRRSYGDRHKTDEYLLIETRIRTTAAASYLELSRYTIYLEDDRGNQVMPAEVEEMPVSTTHMEGTMGDPSDARRSFYMNETNRMKNVFFYFPRKDFYGNPTIRDDIEYLKFVFLMDVGGPGRAEGTWVFRVVE